MKEVIGNLWAAPTPFKIITTNGTVRKDGRAVMGRGCAYQAAQRYPKLPIQLGLRLAEFGNHVFLFQDFSLITFPVKHHWHERADLDLIAQSVEELKALINTKRAYTMVRPGCGNGHLNWKRVRPLLQSLPDNVFIINKE